MKKWLLTPLLGSLSFALSFGQTSFPNSDLESWTNMGNYEQPAGGYWTTANKIVDLLPGFYPATTFKTTDAHSGTYAARMRTDRISPPVNLLVTGTLAVGEFDENGTPPDNLKLGKPFTSRPDKFTGWYKFTSVNSDSCDLYCLLSKWNPTTMMRDTIAWAGLREYTTQPSYIKFELPFNYSSSDSPDSISIVFASSAGGANFQGQVGNELFIDDVALETATGLEIMLMPEVGISVFPNPSVDQVNFNLSRTVRDGRMEILDLNGRAVYEAPFSGEHFGMNVREWATGTYFYRAWEGSEKLNTGTFVIQR
jgi:hypothetical protein